MRKTLDRVLAGMSSIGGRGRETETEIAFMADNAAEWAYEKYCVQDVIPESLSPGLVVSMAPAARTNRGLIKDRHGYSSRS